jgi:hypothetical protein
MSSRQCGDGWAEGWWPGFGDSAKQEFRGPSFPNRSLGTKATRTVSAAVCGEKKAACDRIFQSEGKLFDHTKCGPKQLAARSDLVFTAEMLARSKVIARGRRIKRIADLVTKFGGTSRGWVKKKSWDSSGQEWHWYEHHALGRVGLKKLGEPDPF